MVMIAVAAMVIVVRPWKGMRKIRRAAAVMAVTATAVGIATPAGVTMI
jgi:hypothetical protein